MTLAAATAKRLGVISPFEPLGSSARILRGLRLTLVGMTAPHASQGRGLRWPPYVSGPELVWLRRPLSLLLLPVKTGFAAGGALRLSLSFSTFIASAPAPAAAAPWREHALPASGQAFGPGPALLQRIETVTTRHARALVETLVSRRERVSPFEPTLPATSAALEPPRNVAAARTAPAQPAFPAMVLAPPQPRAAAAEPREELAGASVKERPARAAPPALRVPELQIDRIADQVVRALDQRSLAWRERMGRR